MKRQNMPVVILFALLSVLLHSSFAVAADGTQFSVTPMTIPALQPSDQPKAESSPARSEPLPVPYQEKKPEKAPAPVPAAPDEKSEFEKYISGKASTTTSLDIRQFGYDLFDKPPSTFAPLQNVPVGPDYVVGPGDTIKIDVWGRVEGNWSVAVDTDGNISLPKTGVFGVTGLTFKELKELLHKEFSKYYTGFQMNVSMGPLRAIRVYVVGNAQRPGAYTISSLSTIINALFESGGPSKTGSMRDFQVKRNGKTVVRFDLYDFLLKGDKTRDIRLMPEDVIFIPPVGPLAGIAGNVKTPAIYELKGEIRLLDLIRMAGGLTGNAFKGRVQMQRIEDHQFRTLFEGDLVDIEKNPEKNFILQDGDLAKIFTVLDSASTVTLTGAVAYPGEYGIKSGETRVKEVISLAGGLLYYTSNQAEVTRVTVTQSGPRTEMFMIDLKKAMADDPNNNVPLQMNDYIFLRSVPEWNLYRTVTIAGEVRYPGAYTIKKGETLSSLIDRAGGFTDRAYLRGAIFTRERVREQQQRQIDEVAARLERDLLGSATSQVSTASSTDEARLAQMEVEQKRAFIKQLKTVHAKGRIALKLLPVEQLKATSYDIELEQGDTLTVPSDPKTVQVIGAVYNQSAFVHEKYEGFDHYVKLAGGYSTNADDGNLYILQANGFAAKADGGGFLGTQTKIGSGDTIVVPEKLERVGWMRNIKDITQILYQIAVTAGVLLVVR